MEKEGSAPRGSFKGDSGMDLFDTCRQTSDPPPFKF